MQTLRKAVYGIPALLIAIIITAGSFALVDSTEIVTETVTPPSETLPQSAQVGFLGETIGATGLPIVFDEDQEPDISGDFDGEGLRLTSKQRAVVNFLADVGDRVEITFHIDNMNEETENLMLVNVLAPDTLLIDVVEGGGTDEVRLVGDNLFVMEVSQGRGHDFEVRVTPIAEGVHAFVVEITAIG
jgi:hypothetical protein